MGCCGDSVKRVFVNPSKDIGKAKCKRCDNVSTVQCFYCRELFCKVHMWNQELCMVCGYEHVGESE